MSLDWDTWVSRLVNINESYLRWQPLFVALLKIIAPIITQIQLIFLAEKEAAQQATIFNVCLCLPEIVKV